jgi:hypothetical protein
MIKSFSQFNEELSPELLNRASSKAQQRGQEARSNKFYNASVDAKSKEKKAKQQENLNQFMELTSGRLLGQMCEVDRVNPGRDTFITIKGPFETKNGSVVETIYVTDQGIREGLVETNGKPQQVLLKELVLSRGDAMKYHRFLNWWKEEETPFNIDNYCISGIHV